MYGLTSDSWGKSVTKAIKSSHPAFRLIGLDACSLRVSAPSLRAFTSSNIVPAGELWIRRWILEVKDWPFEFWINSVNDTIAAKGVEICRAERSRLVIEFKVRLSGIPHHPREYVWMWHKYRKSNQRTFGEGIRDSPCQCVGVSDYIILFFTLVPIPWKAPDSVRRSSCHANCRPELQWAST